MFEKREEKCAADLKQGIKPKISIKNLSIFVCSVFMGKRDRVDSKLEPKSLDGKILIYTKEDDKYLVYLPNTHKVVTDRDVIIK